MRSNKKMFNKLILSLLAVVLGAVFSAFNGQPTDYFQTTTTHAEAASPSPQVKGIVTQVNKVVRVVDGDTFEIDTGEKVRMIGIDTPELHHPTKDVQCFGKEAMLKTKDMLEGKMVRLEKDVSETDRYGRLLRFVYLLNLSPTPLPTGQLSEVFVNAYLIKEGFAHAVTFPPDVMKSQEFISLENEARYNKKGLWSNCN